MISPSRAYKLYLEQVKTWRETPEGRAELDHRLAEMPSIDWASVIPMVNQQALDQQVSGACRAQNVENERRIRELLSRWVSGLEPAVCYDQRYNVIGLCDAAARVGDEPFMLGIKS
jgi:hypothetical protein